MGPAEEIILSTRKALSKRRRLVRLTGLDFEDAINEVVASTWCKYAAGRFDSNKQSLQCWATALAISKLTDLVRAEHGRDGNGGREGRHRQAIHGIVECQRLGPDPDDPQVFAAEDNAPVYLGRAARSIWDARLLGNAICARRRRGESWDAFYRNLRKDSELQASLGFQGGKVPSLSLLRGFPAKLREFAEKRRMMNGKKRREIAKCFRPHKKEHP